MYSNCKSFDSLISIRDNFNRDDYDKWFLNENPNWNIQPSIKFSNETPYNISYDYHYKGSKSLFIHLPLLPLEYILLSKYSDQLSHCAIRIRSIKSSKKSIIQYAIKCISREDYSMV